MFSCNSVDSDYSLGLQHCSGIFLSNLLGRNCCILDIHFSSLFISWIFWNVFSREVYMKGKLWLLRNLKITSFIAHTLMLWNSGMKIIYFQSFDYIPSSIKHYCWEVLFFLILETCFPCPHKHLGLFLSFEISVICLDLFYLHAWFLSCASTL